MPVLAHLLRNYQLNGPLILMITARHLCLKPWLTAATHGNMIISQILSICGNISRFDGVVNKTRNSVPTVTKQ